VTDREGRHVQGMGRGDFDLFVDGKKVEIVNFSELAETATKEPAPTPPAEEAAPPAEAAPAPLPERW